ncbi:hypothetical protein [Desulfospira joergensenii]|uniref:hypothetical protein n=1 Tax=Desulfospira joergensenii TaxID=53329 RepID=UPI0003B6F033|nr:hypothetical protein [Desulfospira joergensenii]
MSNRKLLSASSAILEKAGELGASLAGFAGVEDLRSAPGFTLAPQLPGVDEGVGTRDNTTGMGPGRVQWPENARSVLVIGLEHPKEKPEMDWWFGRISPPGNKLLMGIIRELCRWTLETLEINVFHFPYHIEKGGIYLKDAAVLAGLGCIGRNNLLITPRYGPRVRLRAMALDVPMPSTGPMGFDPCRICDDLCRRACPRKAYEETLYTPEAYGQSILPGRDGTYARPVCGRQMQKNIDSAKEEKADGFDAPVKIIRYCRNCELACPVGRT